MVDSSQEIPEDRALAIGWFRKAAERGDSAGQVNLGVMYAAGIGVSKNLDLAAELFQKAAERGNATGQFNLSGMY